MANRFPRNNNNNRNNDDNGDDIAGNIAKLAIGAGLALGAGYTFYKLFGNNETKPESIPFRMNSRHSFSRDSKTYLVNTIEECQYAMRELKS